MEGQDILALDRVVGALVKRKVRIGCFSSSHEGTCGSFFVSGVVFDNVELMLSPSAGKAGKPIGITKSGM